MWAAFRGRAALPRAEVGNVKRARKLLAEIEARPWFRQPVLEEPRFRKENPGYRPCKACVYVGVTSLDPEERFRQHKTVNHRLKTPTQPAFLGVDEIGYLPITRSGTILFFHLVNRGYEHTSMVLTSNKGFEHLGRDPARRGYGRRGAGRATAPRTGSSIRFGPCAGCWVSPAAGTTDWLKRPASAACAARVCGAPFMPLW